MTMSYRCYDVLTSVSVSFRHCSRRAEVMEKGLNTELYWNNDDPTRTVSMVPTSAITGEGIPDLLLWLVKLTQVSAGWNIISPKTGTFVLCACFL